MPELSISTLLIGKTAGERQVIKTTALSQLVRPPRFKYKNFDIDIIAINKVNDLLSITAKAYKDGKEVFVNNPLLFKNPPIKVVDTVSVNEKGLNVYTYKEDLNEALKQIVGDTIRIICK